MPRCKTKFASYDQTRLWTHLAQYPANDSDHKVALDQLRANVRQVVQQAKHIGDLVVRHMPQYTLHNKRHFLNMLGIMDALLPEETLRQLTPLEEALCILAAYTHDLGMALTADEYDKLHDTSTPEGQQYARHPDGFGEELRQIERLQAAGDRTRVDALEGYILSDYIRR
ncbi:MAG: hypothetical protein AAF730_18855 [Bacteroidota bacterium]